MLNFVYNFNIVMEIPALPAVDSKEFGVIAGVAICTALFVFVIYPYISYYMGGPNELDKVRSRQKKVFEHSDVKSSEELQEMLDKQISDIEKVRKQRKLLNEEKMAQIKEQQQYQHELQKQQQKDVAVRMASQVNKTRSLMPSVSPIAGAPAKTTKKIIQAPQPAVDAARIIPSNTRANVIQQQNTEYKEAEQRDILENAKMRIQKEIEREQALLKAQLEEEQAEIEKEKALTDANELRQLQEEFPVEPLLGEDNVIAIQFQFKLTKKMILLLQMNNQKADIKDTYKVTRRFIKNIDTLKTILLYIRLYCADFCAEEYQIVTPFPRNVLYCGGFYSPSKEYEVNLDKTLSDMDINSNSVLLVHSV